MFLFSFLKDVHETVSLNAFSENDEMKTFLCSLHICHGWDRSAQNISASAAAAAAAGGSGGGCIGFRK